MPAIGTCLLGIFAGVLLKNPAVEERKKVLWLIGGGMAMVLAGFAWGWHFPVIKKIWTSSYVLLAGGFSAILLGVFHQIIDVWGYQRWATPFIWIGANAITLYMARSLVKFPDIAARFAGGDVKQFFDSHVAPGAGEFVLACVILLIVVLLARFLYQRRIFLRV